MCDLLLEVCELNEATHSSVFSAWERPSRTAPSQSVRPPRPHPATSRMEMSARCPWMDSILPPRKRNGCLVGESHFENHSVPKKKQICSTFSQYHPAPTAPLSCPMVTLLSGLISSQISTLKMSMRPRSKAPPSRKTLPLFFKPLEPCMTMWILELVPAPLTSPVITCTLYTIPK